MHLPTQCRLGNNSETFVYVHPQTETWRVCKFSSEHIVSLDADHPITLNTAPTDAVCIQSREDNVVLRYFMPRTQAEVEQLFPDTVTVQGLTKPTPIVHVPPILCCIPTLLCKFKWGPFTHTWLDMPYMSALQKNSVSPTILLVRLLTAVSSAWDHGLVLCDLKMPNLVAENGIPYVIDADCLPGIDDYRQRSWCSYVIEGISDKASPLAAALLAVLDTVVRPEQLRPFWHSNTKHNRTDDLLEALALHELCNDRVVQPRLRKDDVWSLMDFVRQDPTISESQAWIRRFIQSVQKRNAGSVRNALEQCIMV